ncbi:sensor histidine kinase [Arcicella rigui]|uniref:Sensor histidine kinase n=1 Tax=Arcicella rigui TaxID=797020 RepID=A0ABU5Q653_9BACT|nr:sensor histidine kinase [Arcicella rigui]MEA5138315.1 sensor histidine kinase [Arcicella rigui]
MSAKNRQIVLHILACVSFMSLPVIFMSRTEKTFFEMFNPLGIRVFVLYFLLLVYFYVNYFVLIPFLFFKRQYFSFAGIQIFIFLLIIILPNAFLHDLPRGKESFIGPLPPPSEKMLHGNGFPPPPTEGGDILTQEAFFFLLMLSFSLMLRISNRWKQTEKEKLNAELSYLKAQINPHFLFNTLNSIYALAIEKSDKTPEAVVKLSGMMRYVLSESSNEYVSLEKEISYIRSYIDLQSIRFEDTINLSFSISGTTFGKKIAPLILIPFIENAFKHGINAEEDSVIKIDISIVENMLKLYVFNNKVSIHLSEESKSGVGILNTSNRLQLLYAGAYELVINDEEKYYEAHLTIHL